MRPTHFALRPGGLQGERGRGCGFFGFTEEAVLLASERQRGAILALGTLPGTQRVPRERLPERYRNDKHQPADQTEAVQLGLAAAWLSGTNPPQQGLQSLKNSEFV